ncbi:MAG: D-alanine--D-alanine ligase [Firmicutes bacterium]|nr:D-alanine--D-alanine ligase [Bacillota bacterium]
MNRTTSLNIALLFGSKSPEHNISIITAFEALNALKKTSHKVVPIYITQSGKFLVSKKFDNINVFKNKKKVRGKEVHFRPSSPFLFSKYGRKINKIDVALLATHGTFGEDGTLQGLLEMSGIAYTGSKVRASANSMDKITMKKLFKEAGLNCVECGVWSVKCEVEGEKNNSSTTPNSIKFPLIIKPSNLGSSIGISIAKNEEELKTALEVAYAFDDRVLVERALTNFSEYNCAVLGTRDWGLGDGESDVENRDCESGFDGQIVGDGALAVPNESGSGNDSGTARAPSPTSTTAKNQTNSTDPVPHLIVSEIEKPISWNEFLTFDDKYNSKNAGSKREFPAKISEEETQQIKDMAKKAFAALDCSGIARVDFLKSKDGEIFVNEINTIPGSFSNYLFPNMTYQDILEKLFEIAIEEKKKKDEKIFIVDIGKYELKSGKGSKNK